MSQRLKSTRIRTTSLVSTPVPQISPSPHTRKRADDAWRPLPCNPPSHCLLALAIAKQGSYAEAAQLLSDVLTRRENSLGADHPGTLAVQRDLEQVVNLQQESAE